MELVLEDLEDLLLVGRLLLPVKPKTGGSTAAGGTYSESKERMVACYVLYEMPLVVFGQTQPG